MRRWLRHLPLLITALWLPLQAVAGMAMPLCQHAAERAAALDAAAPAAHGEHCSGHAGDDAPPAGNAAADMDCDNCEICHFAASGYLLPAESVAASIPAGRDFTPRPLLASPSFIPEPPQQPPKRPS